MRTVDEIQTAISQLSRGELADLSDWFGQFAADIWDLEIEEDIKAGRLDHLVAEADREFEAGRCRPL